jgi:hypothetical protein
LGAVQTYEKELVKEFGRAGVYLGTELLCHYLCFRIWLPPCSSQKQMALRTMFNVLGGIAAGAVFPRGELLTQSDLLCAVGRACIAQWRNGGTFPRLSEYIAWRHLRP